MRRTTRFVALLGVLMVLVTNLTGCALYVKNRAGDLTDVLELSIGAGVFVGDTPGPQLYASAQCTRGGHLAVGKAVTGRVGLYGGRWHTWTESNSALPVAPFVYSSEERDSGKLQAEDFWKYDLFGRWDWFLFLPSNYRDIWSPGVEQAETSAKANSPVHWADLSVEATLLVPSVRFGISPGEFVDFVAGIFGVDPAGDDEVSAESVAGHLEKVLKNAEAGGWYARRHALLEAQRYRPDRAAWKVLRAALDWEDVRLRGMTYYLLTEGEWSAGDRLPLLIHLLLDPDPRFRRNAMQRLAEMKQYAEMAIPALAAMLDESEQSLDRGLAASTLADIAIASRDGELYGIAARALARRLEDADDDVRVQCGAGLEMLGRKIAAAMPDLVRMLAAATPEYRYTALKLLGQLGPDASGALPDVKKALNDPSPMVRHAAKWAIKRIAK